MTAVFFKPPDSATFADFAQSRCKSGDRSLTVNDYLDSILAEPETSLLCSENALPNEIQELFTIPEYCRFGDRDDLTGRLFLGNAGNYAHKNGWYSCTFVVK